MLVELLGIKVKVIRGSRCNVKITTKEDLLLAMSILNTIKLNGVGGRAV